ncbi:MAG: patatin-like phospholipase family protein [Legionella longbeachae]|nr:patatin-like phospholipase family protein [Legionella longbeachae]
MTNGKILTEFLQNQFSNILTENLWITNFSIACNLNTGEEICQKTGLLWENIRASCSLPFIYPPFIRNGQLFVDGGLLNNIPVDHMRTLLGKQSFIIAANVSPTKEDKTFYNFPLVMPFSISILARIKLFYRDFKYPPFLTTLINALLIGSSALATINAESANLLIVPELNEYPSLGVIPDKILKLIEIGYQTTKDKLIENRHIIPK